MIVEVTNMINFAAKNMKWKQVLRELKKNRVGMKNIKKNSTCFVAKNIRDSELLKIKKLAPSQIYRLPIRSSALGQIYGKDYNISVVSIV